MYVCMCACRVLPMQKKQMYGVHIQSTYTYTDIYILLLPAVFAFVHVLFYMYSTLLCPGHNCIYVEHCGVQSMLFSALLFVCTVLYICM